MDRRWVIAVVAGGLDLLLFSTLLNSGTTAGAEAGLVLGYAAAGAALVVYQHRAVRLGYAALWLHAVGAVFLTAYRPTLLLLVGLATLASREPRRPALLGLLATAVPVGLAVADGVREAPPGEGLATLIGLTTLLVVVHGGVFGVARWARAMRSRTRALEHGRAVAARDAVEEERARLAHELHDVVAHSVTLMTLQAAGARKVVHQDPDRAERVLTQVGGAGAQAMAELRALLTALRTDERAGLARIDELVEGVRAAGVEVHLSGSGIQRPVAPEVNLTAYRVVQEALTNVAKHAGPGTRAEVRLAWGPDQLEVEVTDNGRGEPAPGAEALSTGHGLRGLAERVAAAGGGLESGPAPGRGFRVRATLPLPESTSTVDDGRSGAAARAAG